MEGVIKMQNNMNNENRMHRLYAVEPFNMHIELFKAVRIFLEKYEERSE